MVKKIAVFIWDILLAIIAGTLSFGFNTPFSTSLEIQCELQPDKTYICQVRESIFNWTISEQSYEQIIDMDRDLNCSGSGKNKGCSASAQFQTPVGEFISVSRLFTDPTQVQKLISAVKPLMQTRSTPIQYEATRSPIILISVTACLTMVFLLRAFLKLLPERKDKGPITLIRWKRD
ncbi:MAG: hypothetical protein IPG80_17525 [Anaerolineales bacterium]|uniref:hypothetical protein n=1 Tax=Candidatus Villigracilis vicinus TaxID=3140679 RepID=UPI003134731A|nr:hypothetical protein [Anaerolineales bacterium]MBK7448536.1 hypothetical protein [Anaerolineales bacterium]MBK9782541.1 hypothetical protein [Anaerolineales bacterium]